MKNHFFNIHCYVVVFLLGVSHPVFANSDSIKNDQHVYTYSSNLFEYPVTNISKTDCKIWGAEIAQLIAQFDNASVKYQNSEYKPNIVKPQLYTSINKIITHYKKELKNKKISIEVAQTELYSILRKGCVCVYENTEQLESELAEASSITSIINIINQVKIIQKK